MLVIARYSASSTIEPNKNLSAARSNLLTVEEEERISDMLQQQDEDAEEKYGHAPFVEREDEREVELDSLLQGLDFSFNITEDQEDGENEKSTMRGLS